VEELMVLLALSIGLEIIGMDMVEKAEMVVNVFMNKSQ
jgi:hypothetical protein